VSAAGIPRRRITLADVASHAGVSRSTASLVWQNGAHVAPETRRRVLASAKKLGYVYHRGAASLRTRHSHTIGVLITGLENPFFADLTEGVEDEMRPAGYVVLLASTFDDLQRQDVLVRTMLEQQVDGLLLIPAIDSGMDLAEPLQRLGIPYVLATRHLAGISGSYVGPDDRAGGRLAAEHLVRHGVGNVAYFGGGERGTARIDRLAGVREILADTGISENHTWTVPSETSSTDGYAVAAALVGRHDPPDAVICHSDAIAFGLMRALQDRGVLPGRDCRVIGFDDVEHARAWSPALTSVSAAPRSMGRRAARMLLDRIADPSTPDESVVLHPKLALRESCGCGGDGHSEAQPGR
jgi:LacI family transcriptional regulator